LLKKDKKLNIFFIFHDVIWKSMQTPVSRWVIVSWSRFAYVTKFDRYAKRKHIQVFWVIQVQITLLLSLHTLHKYLFSYSTLEPTSYITYGKAAKIQLISATYKRFTIVFAYCIRTYKRDDETTFRFFVLYIFLQNYTYVILHALCEAVLRWLSINIKDYLIIIL